MKKILFLLPDLKLGGAQRNTVNIINHLSNKYDCTIITVNKKKIELKIKNNIKIETLNSYKLRFSLITLYLKIIKFSPDIIYSSIGYINITAILINFLLLKKTKVIIREANYLRRNINNSNYKILNLIMYKFFYKHAFRIICSSENMAEDLKDLLKIKEVNKIIKIDNFINEDEINIKLKDKKKLLYRKKLLFIAAGRLTKQKGFDRLIKHFIKYRYQEIKLIIFGEGEENKNLINLINENNLKNVIIRRTSKNIWYWLAQSDYFILSSRWEGMPNILLEALHCGTKIIDFSNLKQLDEVFQYIEKENCIRHKFVNRLDIENLKKKQKFQNKSLLPKQFSLKSNISKLQYILDGQKI